MDEDGIRLVFARVSELRTKITNSIHIAIDDNDDEDVIKQDTENEDCLLNIRDALQSLETQLSSLQALQEQQLYEKEAFLVEIDYSRKILLQKLKEYKGDDDLEVIQEATAFASSTIEIENNDLLLPPYPTRLSSESHFRLTPNISQNGVMVNHSTNDLKGLTHQSKPRGLIKGWREVIGATAKTIFTVVGFMAVLSLSGFEQRAGKSDRGMLQKYQGVNGGCPTGKFLLIENGETRCLVKERVEIPFLSVATTPDVNYGCG